MRERNVLMISCSIFSALGTPVTIYVEPFSSRFSFTPRIIQPPEVLEKALTVSHIDFGSIKRGWNFRSLGHGQVNFEEIIRVLNAYDNHCALAVEWEDSGMERISGGTEACAFVRKVDFEPSDVKFDDAIANK